MKLNFGSFAVRLAAVLCVLALAAPLFAQEGSLEVKCTGPDGSAISGVKVFALPFSNAKPKEAKSDKAGVALFKKLDEGVYRVLCRMVGYAPAYAEFFYIAKSGPKQTAELKFAAGDPNAKLYFEDQSVSQKAFTLLDEGVKFLQAGKFAEGEKALRDSLSIYPSNPDTNYNLAIALVQQKKFDECVPVLQRTVQVASALSHIPMQNQQPGTENPYALRQKDAEDLLNKVPSFKLRAEGENLARERKFDEAIAKYNEVLKLEPNDSDMYYNISLAQANAKRYDEAMKAAEKAIQLRPQEKDYVDLKKRIIEIQENEVLIKAKTLLEEGDALYKAEDFSGALKKYEAALPMIPQNKQAIVYVQLGRAQGKLKNGDLAVQNFKKAIDLSPDVVDYRKALAQYYLGEKRYDEALEVYADPRSAGNSTPDQALFSLGQTLSKQGNTEVAELAYAKALKLNPNHAEAAYEYGMSLYFSKKNDKLAQEILGQYLKISKDAARIDNVNSVLVVIKKRNP